MAKGLNALLNEIQQAAGVTYLSDLHSGNLSLFLEDQAKDLIMAIPDSVYPLETWNKAVYYITGRPSECRTIVDVKQKIIASR